MNPYTLSGLLLMGAAVLLVLLHLVVGAYRRYLDWRDGWNVPAAGAHRLGEVEHPYRLEAWV